jgi:predicted small secreted protein
MRMRTPTILAAAALILASCGTTGGDGTQERGGAAVTGLAIAPASFDLHVGTSQRLILAVFTDQRDRIAGGEVTLRLAFLGDEPGGEAELGPPQPAAFLPIPGLDVAQPARGPAVVESNVLSGVYRAEVDLDRAGFWGVFIEASLVGGPTVSGQTVLRVLDAPEVPAIGDPAPSVDNLTTADVLAGLAEAQALDSRLRSPDDRDSSALLHERRVSDSLAAGRPIVVTVSTPVYCVSLVCGPLTDHMTGLAQRFGDRADFIHLEVWRDFEAQELNPAAAAWIQTASGGNEPWVFLVDATGTIIARWDNVLDTGELEALLSELAVLDAG